MRHIEQQRDDSAMPVSGGRTHLQSFLLVVALALLPLFKAPAAAAMDGETAVSFIDRLGKEAFATLQQSRVTEPHREAAFGRILRKGFDLDLIGRFALGKYWRQATPGQKADYLDVFSRFVIKTYARRLGSFSAQSFVITGSTTMGERGDILVQTRIDRPGAAGILAGWRVREIEGAPKIIDVMVEGVSMTIMQRHEFASVTGRGGIEALVQTLRLQTAKLSAAAG